MMVPVDAVLRQEKEGVRWYTLTEERGWDVHYMQIGDYVLSGVWVGPRAIFQALATMMPEQRVWLMSSGSHDAAMGIVRERIAQIQKEEEKQWRRERETAKALVKVEVEA